MLDFYNIFFKNIYFHKNKYNVYFDLGLILGSLKSDNELNIYLNNSITNNLIPKYVLENGRKISKYNNINFNNMKKDIIDKLKLNYNISIDNTVLIINRRDSRQLENINSLIKYLKIKGFNTNIIYLENMNLFEQIKTVSKYKYIITACGSVQVHITFLNKNSKYIELCESGFRYPNTSIYGYYNNIETYSICIPLSNIVKEKLSSNFMITHFFNIANNLPNIIKNTSTDIEREKLYYSKLIELNLFFIHNIQNIDCNQYIKYIDLILP